MSRITTPSTITMKTSKTPKNVRNTDENIYYDYGNCNDNVKRVYRAYQDDKLVNDDGYRVENDNRKVDQQLP